MGSEVFKQRRAYAEQKVRDKVVDDVNRSIESTVNRLINSEEFGQVRATEDALKKVEMIVDEYHHLTDAANIKPQEVGFFLLSDEKTGEGVISDIYIPNNQIVTDVHCNISGYSKMFASGEFEEGPIRLMSWGHSHGDLLTFLSPEDVNNLKDAVYKRMVQIKVNPEEGLKYVVRVSPTIVVNVHGSKYAAVQYKFKKLKKTPIGTPIGVSDEVCLNRGPNKQGLNIQVIQNNGNEIQIDRQQIRQELLYGHEDDGGVVIDRAGQKVRLSDLIEESRSIKTEEIIDPVKTEGVIEPIQEDLSTRVKVLSTENKNLRGQYQTLETDYNELSVRNEQLQNRINEIESAQNLTYSQRIQSYSSSLLKSTAKRRKNFGIFTRILSGRYRGDINDIKSGNFEENPEKNRIWGWDDRINAVTALYTRQIDDFADLELRYVNTLRTILDENNYINRTYRTRIEKLINRFYK